MKISDSKLQEIKQKIDELVKQGSSQMYAVSSICDIYGLNIIDVCNQLGISNNSTTNNSSDDIAVGDYVLFNNDESEKYEVINISDNEYILRNTSNNEVVDAKQEEITPIVMENNMTSKLNEAQYSISINGLETTDAETLSQMLSLAGQAEQGGMEGSFPYQQVETLPVSEPTDIDTYEPTIPATMDGPGFEAAEVDNYENPMSDELPPEGDYPAEVEEVALNEGEISEDVLIPSDKEEEMKDSSSEENLGDDELKESDEGDNVSGSDDGEESDSDFDEDIAETLRIAGVQLDEVSDEDANKGKKDLPIDPVGKANPAKTADVPEGQAPDYKEVSTEDVTGYDSSKGFEPAANLKVESTLNQNKINSILETAKSMYAKKGKDAWLALDRRYIEKLILEGVGYTNASKMLQNAKMGK